ncbi:MAG TPA: alginate lyase family protein [Gemmatimonadaceae bacterium]|jgi:hypothetical protein|nr:alginate lyase family protein [Gemmatimonadaceae bacterium]
MLDDPSVRRRTVTTLPHELRVRGAQALHSFRERVGLALGDGAMEAPRTPRGVVRALRDAPDAIAAAAREQLRAGMLPGLRDVAGTVALLRRTLPHAEVSTRCRAERAVDGVLHLLGHDAVDCGLPIDWHRDPSSGMRAPLRHWSRIAYLDPSVVGDYKLLWELNRHQHFVTLGQAYAYSRDARYAEAFVTQLTGWIAANPPQIGVNWASSLELSYRAISWLWALQLFADAPQLTDDVLLATVESLRRHALHIERYLSTYYSPNTHLTGEALGLLYVGTAMPFLEAARGWRTLGRDILRDQLFRQVRADGTYFEQALYYHRYTADIYHHALLLADTNGWPRDAAMRERVRRLDETLANITYPDGTVPLVGDDDGGRLMRLDGLSLRDVRPTLTTGAALLGAPELRRAGPDATEECLWLLGAGGASALAALAPVDAPMRSRGFTEGGLYVLRDARSGLWALVDGGAHGALNCGHAHADALHLEVALDGRALLTDSGTFSYTGDGREQFRATASHNTVTVDGESSSITGGLFHWRHAARTTTQAWLSMPNADVWRGSHDGFARLPDPAVHERTVLLLHGRYLVVLDALEAAGAHRWTVHWHWSAGLVARRGDTSAWVRASDEARADATLLQLLALGDGSLEIGRSWRSDAYGVKREAPCTDFSASGSGRQTSVTLIAPGAAQLRAVGTDPNRTEIAGARFRDTIVRRGAAPRVVVAEVETDAECAVLNGDEDGQPERVILFGATYAQLPGMDRQAIVGGAPFAARAERGHWQTESFHAGLTEERG